MHWNLQSFIPLWVALINHGFRPFVDHTELQTDIRICCLSSHWLQIIALVDVYT